MDEGINQILVELGKREQSDVSAANQRATLFKSVEEIRHSVSTILEQNKHMSSVINDHEKRIKSLERIRNGFIAIGAFLAFLGTAASDVGIQIAQRLAQVLGIK